MKAKLIEGGDAPDFNLSINGLKAVVSNGEVYYPGYRTTGCGNAATITAPKGAVIVKTGNGSPYSFSCYRIYPVGVSPNRVELDLRRKAQVWERKRSLRSQIVSLARRFGGELELDWLKINNSSSSALRRMRDAMPQECGIANKMVCQGRPHEWFQFRCAKSAAELAAEIEDEAERAYRHAQYEDEMEVWEASQTALAEAIENASARAEEKAFLRKGW